MSKRPGNPDLTLVDNLWHRYTAEEIDGVIAMIKSLEQICPAPNEFGVKPCPMNCPFLPWKSPNSYDNPNGCYACRMLLGDKWRLQRWVDRQSSDDPADWQTIERDG